jgi:hypothetical protein
VDSLASSWHLSSQSNQSIFPVSRPFKNPKKNFYRITSRSYQSLSGQLWRTSSPIFKRILFHASAIVKVHFTQNHRPPSLPPGLRVTGWGWKKPSSRFGLQKHFQEFFTLWIEQSRFILWPLEPEKAVPLTLRFSFPMSPFGIKGKEPLTGVVTLHFIPTENPKGNEMKARRGAFRHGDRNITGLTGSNNPFGILPHSAKRKIPARFANHMGSNSILTRIFRSIRIIRDPEFTVC